MMAFRFGDPGGRMYQTAGTSQVNILAYWTSMQNGSQFSVQSGGGRTTGTSLRGNFNGPVTIAKTLSSSVATMGVAFAYRPSVIPSSEVTILSLTDAGSVQVDIRLKIDGTIRVTRNGTLLGTSTAVLGSNVYAHLEFKATIDPSAGAVELRLNGVAIIGPLTSQNTRATANSTVNGVMIGNNISGSISGTHDYDDLIVWDTTTTDPAGNTDISNFIGDCGLTWLLPTGAGTTTQWTPDSGSNWARVSEVTPDGNTSYVEDSTVGHIDTYAMADLAASAASVKSIAVVNYAEKTDVGARGMKAEIRTNAANFAFANEIALGNSYQYYFSNWGFNPSGTPAAWTVSDVNSIEVGQQVTS
jgi:hypothetical protein